MILSKFLQRAFCFGISGFLAGCTTQNAGRSNSSALLAPADFPSTYERSIGNERLLLVGLEPYLGKGTTHLKIAKPFRLISVGQPLVLKDASGIVHKSTEITITWRAVALSEPQEVSYQVAGPFASFESAERLALILQKKGFLAVVAHPDEWEVWVPQEKKLPDEKHFVSRKKIKASEIKPVLQGFSGEILLSGPLQIEAPDGLTWKDGVYVGSFRLQANAYGSWTFIHQVPIERYLMGVVPYEIGSNAPSAALAAQAILARTWALANTHRFAIDGYHLCSDTQCQVYKNPNQVSQRVRSAITNTAGKYLSWKSKPIHAVYHASNGGVMASATEAWSITSLPYLKAQLDGSKEWREKFVLPISTDEELKALLDTSYGVYGVTHSRFRWTRTIKAGELMEKLESFKKSNTLPGTLKVLERGKSGRVLALEIVGEQKQLRRVLQLDEIRRVLRELPSTLFVVNELKDGIWQFSGGGFGHGVGLSQAGAIDLASRGWKTSKILMHYYPGATYGTLQDLPNAP